MKYEYKKGQYMIDIDFEKQIVIIEDIFNIIFKNKILLNINKNINNEIKIKEKINQILNYNYNGIELFNMLKLSIEDNENIENILKL
jgi:hypothetical protein